eukprot:2966745-Heterocapsa_arctica.AAC.1
MHELNRKDEARHSGITRSGFGGYAFGGAERDYGRTECNIMVTCRTYGSRRRTDQGATMGDRVEQRK